MLKEHLPGLTQNKGRGASLPSVKWPLTPPVSVCLRGACPCSTGHVPMEKALSARHVISDDNYFASLRKQTLSGGIFGCHIVGVGGIATDIV